MVDEWTTGGRQRNCTRIVGRRYGDRGSAGPRRTWTATATATVTVTAGMNKHRCCMQMEDGFKGSFREFGKGERGVVTTDILFFWASAKLGEMPEIRDGEMDIWRYGEIAWLAQLFFGSTASPPFDLARLSKSTVTSRTLPSFVLHTRSGSTCGIDNIG